MKIELNPGEIYIGHYGTSPDETTHVILLPGDNVAAWETQTEWAKSIGGDLPNRTEQAMLWANHRDQFKKDFYWSNETHPAESGWAWSLTFNYGSQYNLHKYDELRARAVRRIKEPRHD